MTRSEVSRIRFTKAALERLAALPPDRATYHYDEDGPRGLAVRVTPKGAVTFCLYRSIRGRPQRITIGRWPDLNVVQARAEAARLNAKIASGENPAHAKAQLRAELTFAELYERYLNEHARPRKRTWRQDVQMFERYLKPWANRRLSEITRADVVRVHNTVGTGTRKRRRGTKKAGAPYQANRLLAVIRKVFNFAALLGWAGDNPAKGVPLFREESRERFLTAEELPFFLASLAVEPDETFRDALMMLLLTGARRSNVFAMRWDQVSLSAATWTIPAGSSKNARSMTLPLVPEAVAILERRAANGGDSRPYVFASYGRSGYIVEPRNIWRAILTRAEALHAKARPEARPISLQDVRIHDLRRTLGSVQAALGSSLSVIGASLGHKSLSATQVYARLDLSAVRQSVSAATRAMLSAGLPQDDPTSTEAGDGDSAD